MRPARNSRVMAPSFGRTERPARCSDTRARRSTRPRARSIRLGPRARQSRIANSVNPSGGRRGISLRRAEVGRMVVVDRNARVHPQRHGRRDNRRGIVQPKGSAPVASVKDSGRDQLDPFGRRRRGPSPGAGAVAGAPAVSITNEGISLPARVSLSPPVRVMRSSIEAHCASRFALA